MTESAAAAALAKRPSLAEQETEGVNYQEELAAFFTEMAKVLEQKRNILRKSGNVTPELSAAVKRLFGAAKTLESSTRSIVNNHQKPSVMQTLWGQRFGEWYVFLIRDNRRETRFWRKAGKAQDGTLITRTIGRDTKETRTRLTEEFGIDFQDMRGALPILEIS